MGQYLLDADDPVPGRLRAVTRVVVVGAGIVGAAVARELAVRGVARDAARPRRRVSSGTTGLGEGNVLCGRQGRGAGARPGARRAGALRRARGAARRRGAHPPQGRADRAPGRGDVGGRAGPARAPGVPGARLLDAGEVRAPEPELTGPMHGASLFPGDLQCDPRAIARALAREAGAARRGARGLRGRGDRVRRRGVAPRRCGERVAARAVVLAAGPWSAPLAASAGLPLPLEPRKGQLVRLAAPAARLDPAQGRRRLLPGRRRRRRRRPRGLHRRRDHVGGRRARRLVARAARVRHVGRPGAERRAARARRAAVPRPARAARRRAPGPACARGSPTTSPRSARRAASPASGSRPATKAPASRSARSPAACSRSSTPASPARRPRPVHPGPLRRQNALSFVVYGSQRSPDGVTTSSWVMPRGDWAAR